jgi:hypothetical protein
MYNIIAQEHSIYLKPLKLGRHVVHGLNWVAGNVEYAYLVGGQPQGQEMEFVGQASKILVSTIYPHALFSGMIAKWLWYEI